MKRTSTVKVKFGRNDYAEAVVTTFTKFGLTRAEAERSHDAAVDNVVGAIRSLPYQKDAPLRNVTIRGGRPS